MILLQTYLDGTYDLLVMWTVASLGDLFCFVLLFCFIIIFVIQTKYTYKILKKVQGREPREANKACE